MGLTSPVSADEPAVTSDSLFTNDRALTINTDYLELSTPFGESTTQTITLTATQDLSLRVAGEYPTPGDSFYVTRAGVCPGYFGTVAMKTGDSCTLTIVFTPSTTGSYFGGPSFSATANGVTTPVSIHLHGNVETVVVEGPASFGTIDLGSSSTQQYTLTNVARYDYTVTELLSGLATYYGFNIADTTCGSVIPAGTSCTVDLRFEPLYTFDASTYVSSLGTMNNQKAYSNGVRVTGSGHEGIVGLTATPSVDFGSVAEDGTASGVIVLHNTGEVRLTFNTYNSWFSDYSGAFALENDLPAVLEPGESAEVGVVFTAALTTLGEQVSDYNIAGYTSIYTAANAKVSLRALVAENAAPVDPVDPSDPIDPTNPTGPGVPINPIDPLVPTEPVTPTPPNVPDATMPPVEQTVVPPVTQDKAAEASPAEDGSATTASASAPALAATGTNDSVVVTAAALLLLTGFGALVATRRKRAQG